MRARRLPRLLRAWQRAPFEPRAIADLFKSIRIAIAVCANDLPKELALDLASETVQNAPHTLSQAHAFFKESENLLDVVAVGGINTGRDAYLTAGMDAESLKLLVRRLGHLLSLVRGGCSPYESRLGYRDNYPRAAAI